MTERPQLFIIGEEIITEILKVDGAVIGNAVDQVFLRNFRTDSFLEDPAEFGDVLLAETEPDSHRMPAVTGQEMRAF